MSNPKRLTQADVARIAEILGVRPGEIKRMVFELYNEDMANKRRDLMEGADFNSFSICPCPPDYRDWHYTCCE